MAENRLASVEEMTTESSTPAAQKGEIALGVSAATKEAGPAPRRTFTFWKGRVALYAILKALDVRPGDRVILPGYTCFAVPSAVVFAGAQPVYADIDRETYHPSAASMIAACRNGGRPPRAILIQHTFGIPADTVPIVAWAREQGIAVIEDCAHVLGSRYRDSLGAWREVGTLGDAAFYSSQWNKPVSTGIGGWASTSDPELATAMQRFHAANCVPPSLRETCLLAAQVAVRGIASSPWVYWSILAMYRGLYMRGVLVGSSSGEELQGVMPADYAKRMSGLQEFLLNRRMRDRSNVTRRRQLKAVYDECLKSAGMAVLKVPEYADAVPLRYPVRVSDKKRALAEARRRRIELGDWYPHPIDLPNGVNGAAFGYQEGMCPEGERAAREVINLPMHGGISEREAQRIVDFLKQVA
ncbi:MAG TPA: DegT/DnrJ/EryC1/StrS family aminotransferase [Terriglobales bacterium]|nr:DegT/DnrJ/EryC1/StrS family aminotransferase [Terriglobales bacterium]